MALASGSAVGDHRLAAQGRKSAPTFAKSKAVAALKGFPSERLLELAILALSQ